MKSMEQMQNEMLSRCYKKGGWPRPVACFGGVMRLAKDQEHLDKIRKEEFQTLIFGVAGAVVIMAGILILHDVC